MAVIMTLEEVAIFLRVHHSTVYRLLRKHHIPAFKLGSDWRFNQESIEKWILDKEGQHVTTTEGATTEGATTEGATTEGATTEGATTERSRQVRTKHRGQARSSTP
jgi:excisionase family DNA binding protein